MAHKLKGGPDARYAVSANRLRDGMVVWWQETGWTELFAAAAALDAAGAVVALHAAQREEAAQVVVGSYIVELDGNGQPLRQRERIRAAGGPSMPYGVAA